MGFLDAYKKRSTGLGADADSWTSGYSSPSLTGIQVNQLSALNSSPVLAATSMLAEDVAKLPWTVFRKAEDESRTEAKDHFLYDLLQEPNEWMNGLEYREMKQIGLILRGNAYSLIKRNGRGRPIALIPWNPDHVNEWIGGDGSIFYRFNPQNLHEIAILKGFPFLVPADDVLHIRGFSLNGLLGMSRIALAREAIALGLAEEQQAARWMGQGARPSGMMTTDQKLNPGAAERLKTDIKQAIGGLQNSGKILIGEQGLKFQPFSMTSADLEFIASRQFQLQEVARIFRIPPHMLGEMSRCMPADTLVYTEHGPARIVDVKVGEKVWSVGQSGVQLAKVLNNWENGVDDLLEISTTNRRFRCNAQHRVLARRRHREIGPIGPVIRWTTEYIEAGKLRAGDTVVTLDKLPSQQLRTAPNGRELTPDFMAFCGLLLGDGNVTKVKNKPVGVQIARAATAGYMDYYRAVMRSEFVGGGWSKAWGEGHHLARLTVSQVDAIRAAPLADAKILAAEYGVHRSTAQLARKKITWRGPAIAPPAPIFLTEEERTTKFKSVSAACELDDLGFSGIASTKRVPAWVFGLAEDLRLSLVRGFLDADGTVNKKGRAAFDSINAALLEDIRHLCIGAGIPVTNVQTVDQITLPPNAKRPVHTRMYRFTCSDPVQNARIGSHDPRYVARFAAGKGFGRKNRNYPRHGGRGFDIPGASLARISSIRKLPAEKVFDLEVEGTHCFVADGVIVHNSTNNNIAQMAQEYINFTLTGYTNRWRAKMSSHFGLRRDNLSIEFDYGDLTTADMTSRVNNWRTMIMSMIAKPDEARIDLGMQPEGGEANKLHFPQNMAAAGSQSTGTAPDEAGRPEGT